MAGIVTNVEPDHLDHWGTFEAIEDGVPAVRHRASRTDGGFVVVCVDDPGGARLAEAAREAAASTCAPTARPRTPTSGVERCSARGSNGWRFDVVHRGVRSGAWRCRSRAGTTRSTPRRRWSPASAWGSSRRGLRAGWRSFSGTRRRFDFKGEADGVRVYDDYAHHPTEIAATLRAAREVVGEGRLVVAFQAHHYYRTAMFVEEFGEALGLADEVVVLGGVRAGGGPDPRAPAGSHGPPRPAAGRSRSSSSRRGPRSPATWPTGRARATS